jgi:uracil-DNA glycosylase
MNSLRDQMHPNWIALLSTDLEILDEIEFKLGGEDFLPLHAQVMQAFKHDPMKVKVLILGQDPYPKRTDAMGLAFSVSRESKRIPASLQNIYRELVDDLGTTYPTNGDLSPWSDQGVILLNRSLTCRPGESDSHEYLGWQRFTDSVVGLLAEKKVCAILWGKSAAKNSHLFSSDDLFISAHPSPLSAYRGFFGSKPFSKVNTRLIEKGEEPINWELG